MKCPSIVISVDATNCYDRVAYPFASLTAQYFGITLNHIIVLLQAIQSMNIHLQTLFGISKLAYCGTILLPFQGAAQGNRAAPVS